VWQATYLPFGYEYNPQIGVNKYKFTDYQRDSESGLDYANFRYYNSTIDHFMSPDPIDRTTAVQISRNREASVKKIGAFQARVAG
jgi:RHS repeat-associated protein